MPVNVQVNPLESLIQGFQAGQQLTPAAIQQRNLSNQLALQLQQIQLQRAQQEAYDYFHPEEKNMRTLRATLSGETRNPLSPTVRLSPLEVGITTPIALPGAITQAQQSALTTPAIDEAGFPVLNQSIPRAAALGESIVPILSDTGQPTGFADDFNKLIAGAGRQRRIENIIKPTEFNLSQGESRFRLNPETGQGEVIASVAEKGIAPKTFSLNKGEKLFDAQGKQIAENPSDAPRPTIVPSGGVVLDAEGNEKFKNDKPVSTSGNLQSFKIVKDVYDDSPSKNDYFGRGQLRGSSQIKSDLDAVLTPIKNNFNKLSPQGAASFLTAFNKLRDPTSATLLAEARQIADRQGLGTRFETYITSLKTGRDVSPTVAKDIYNIVSQTEAMHKSKIIEDLLERKKELDSLGRALTSIGVPKSLADEVERVEAEQSATVNQTPVTPSDIRKKFGF